jgi:hypothetical protein
MRVNAAFDIAPLIQHLGLEVRQVPFRAEKGRRINVATKPIAPTVEKGTVSSTVCTELYDSELYDGGAIIKKSHQCVTASYEYQTYVVRAGDTLGRIAKHFYGTANLWPLIYQANKAAMGKDPHLPGALRAGMKLHIVMSTKKETTTEPAR